MHLETAFYRAIRDIESDSWQISMSQLFLIASGNAFLLILFRVRYIRHCSCNYAETD